jgi:beta-phosphoglucomutase-like phosphatase (HAD superfamily)
MAFKAVILDIDGTLVLSNDAHAQAWVEALQPMAMMCPSRKFDRSSAWGATK